MFKKSNQQESDIIQANLTTFVEATKVNVVTLSDAINDLSESVNANTLASFVKEQRSLNKEQTPAWLEAVVKTTDKVTVGVRKS